MNLTESARVALRALLANRLRSALTTLGVLIGVLAVVLLVAIGQGAREEITDTVEGLGSNLLFAFPGSGDFTRPLPARSRFTNDVIDDVAREFGDPRRVAADLVSGEVVRAGGNDTFASVLGITEFFTTVIDRDVARGEDLTGSDIVAARRVAVIGPAIGTELFGDRDPIGRDVTIAGLRFRVVGVLTAVGGSAFGPDRDSQVLVPITTAQRLFGTDRVDNIFVKSTSAADVAADAEIFRRALSQRFDEADFSVLTQDDILGVISDILGLLTIVLGAIAGISLLVGGVGVSNIMLVSVTERTREIGLRKALGARPRDLALQFLLEAVVLTGTGGLAGLGLGIGLAALVDAVAPVPTVVTGWSVALAFGVSVAVGLFFGVWPAVRAGRLDPVEALRHE
ncbi:MAG: ABC transporter permease [Nitriliruptorales bacterium]|nr:ABC transporter permease [Nitriliruptorales bacterium]